MSKKEEALAKVNEFKGIILEGLKVDPTTSIAAESEKGSAFTKCIPEDLSMSVIKNVHEFEGNFAAGAVAAIGDLAVAHMAANANVDKVVGKVQMSSSSHTASATVHRESTFTNRFTDSGEPTTVVKPGSTRVNIATPGSSGAIMDSVFNDIAAAAVAQLSKKK